MAYDRLLRAGALSAQLEGSDLRYVKVGALEVIRRLYVAVRDDAWNTIPGELSDFEVRERDDRFGVTWAQRHRRDDIDFSWRGEIEGLADGTLTYAMVGEAAGDFDYNRIGICVLHPREAAGSRYRAWTPQGEIDGALPADIGPQLIVDGKLTPLFPSFDALEVDQDAVCVRLAFEGDLFEMEDQRNWTDASFKTYSTPLALGFPHRAASGQRIVQRVTMTIVGEPPPASEAGELRIELGEALGRGLPQLGLALTSRPDRLTTREIDLLERLRLDHLRVDLHLSRPGYEEELERAVEACEALGSGLELALFVGAEPDRELTEVAGRVAKLRPPLRRALVFAEGEIVTPNELVRLARERLAAPCAGGTDVYFADVNRAPPDPGALDALVFSINPQVHAFDDASLVESVAAQADTVTSGRALAGGKPVVVSPVTLRPRYNPFAPDAPPLDPDPRQETGFAAAWTLGSVKYLAEAGAESVTYFETTGERGLLAHESDEVYPVYEVFARLAELKDAEVVAATSTDPLTVDALALRDADGLHVLVANMTGVRQQAWIGTHDIELAPHAVVVVG